MEAKTYTPLELAEKWFASVGIVPFPPHTELLAGFFEAVWLESAIKNIALMHGGKENVPKGASVLQFDFEMLPEEA